MLCMDGGFSGCIKLCKGVGEVWIKMWATVLRVLAGRGCVKMRAFAFIAFQAAFGQGGAAG
ncbi:hypothetical protein [Kingella oralis]|jgi:hypothetical protein|uniref:hypothetical protein n=1 Tax=Kingella oralis TaxID=505 RepID=UPI0028EF6736|nr:hypothetical protein [Kingella oralis]